ncbi:hypothetical protein HDV00_010630 [Rhizophlyctis rosea]|nr:hypothetical protein HDV00_010630 [Rhizophlyctis rosea]
MPPKNKTAGSNRGAITKELLVLFARGTSDANIRTYLASSPANILEFRATCKDFSKRTQSYIIAKLLPDFFLDLSFRISFHEDEACNHEYYREALEDYILPRLEEYWTGFITIEERRRVFKEVLGKRYWWEKREDDDEDVSEGALEAFVARDDVSLWHDCFLDEDAHLPDLDLFQAMFGKWVQIDGYTAMLDFVGDMHWYLRPHVEGDVAIFHCDNDIVPFGLGKKVVGVSLVGESEGFKEVPIFEYQKFSLKEPEKGLLEDDDGDDGDGEDDDEEGDEGAEDDGRDGDDAEGPYAMDRITDGECTLTYEMRCNVTKKYSEVSVPRIELPLTYVTKIFLRQLVTKAQRAEKLRLKEEQKAREAREAEELRRKLREEREAVASTTSAQRVTITEQDRTQINATRKKLQAFCLLYNRSAQDFTKANTELTKLEARTAWDESLSKESKLGKVLKKMAQENYQGDTYDLSGRANRLLGKVLGILRGSSAGGSAGDVKMGEASPPGGSAVSGSSAGAKRDREVDMAARQGKRAKR